MIISCHSQRSIYETLADGILGADKEESWKEWVEIDKVLEDEEIVGLVEEALSRRSAESRCKGRPGTLVEVVLRLLVLKHIKNWSYAQLRGEVRANLVYRRFTRIEAEKVPDDKTMVRLGQTVGPNTIGKIHERVVQICREKKVVKGRRMRVDTTVVESNIHHPTDSSLLADGVRMITRTVKRITERIKIEVRFRNRTRSVTRQVLNIARKAISMVKKSSESAAEQIKGQTAGAYRKLIYTTGRVIKQAQRVMTAARIAVRTTRSAKRRFVEKLIRRVGNVVHLTQKVIRQSKARIFQGDTHFKDKIVSLHEPGTEIIRKGKAAKPTEFGKMVKIQEAENQIITDYAVYTRRPQDADILIPSIERHQQLLGRSPDLVAADAAFFTSSNQKDAENMGVIKLGIPNCRTRDPEKRAHHKERWFRKSQRWRVGCEGRISVIKRRHGLSRSLYKGYYGMQRWVGWGVVSNNLIRLKEIALTG